MPGDKTEAEGVYFATILGIVSASLPPICGQSVGGMCLENLRAPCAVVGAVNPPLSLRLSWVAKGELADRTSTLR